MDNGFIDLEELYSTDDTGLLTTSEYWSIIKEEYYRMHPDENWWKEFIGDLPRSLGE